MRLRRENEAVLHDLGYVVGVERAPCRVDFNLVFPSEDNRSKAEAAVTALGFDWQDCNEAVEEGTFEATAFKTLSRAAQSITDSEIALINCLAAFGGKVDGWGFCGDSVH